MKKATLQRKLISAQVNSYQLGIVRPFIHDCYLNQYKLPSKQSRNKYLPSL